MTIVNDVFVGGTAGKLSIDFEAAIDRNYYLFLKYIYFLSGSQGLECAV